ncbi:MAG: hypothetical protein OEY01_03800 [Desulfobulbaceae bacterium]|nr:hypothetical protein [Desulfobulbaceae bacterium]
MISKYLSDGLREKTAQNYQINAAKAILFFMENFKEYEKLQKAFEASELEAKAKAKEETEMLQEAFEASEPQSWEDFVYEPKTLDRSSSPMKTVADLYQHTKENTKMSAYKQKIALDGLETACNMADPISLIDKKTYIKTLREKGKNLSKIKARNYLLALEESIECFTKDFYRTEGQEFTLGDLLTFMDFYTHHIPHEYHPRSTATRKQDLYTVRKAIQYFRTDRPLLSAFNLSQSKFKQHLDDDGEMTKSTIATYVRGFKGTFLTFMVFYKFWEKPQLLQPEVEVAEVEVTEEAEVGVTEEAEVAGEALIESVKAAIVEQLQQVAFTAPEPPTTIEVEEVVLPEPSKLSQKLQLKGDRVFKYEVPETGLTSNEAMRIALRILTEVVDFDEKDLDRLQTVAGTVKTI